jgi:hypothetical protein
VQVEIVEVQLLSRYFAPGKRFSSGFLSGSVDVNRIPVMAPILAPILGSFLKGVYLPQKLTPKSSIETEYKRFQKHVPSY